MWARFTVLNETPIASAIAGCVIPLSRSSTIWMRSRCAAGIFHRSAVFNCRICFLVHLTIRPPESDSQSESYRVPSCETEKRQKSPDSNSYGSGITRNGAENSNHFAPVAECPLCTDRPVNSAAICAARFQMPNIFLNQDRLAFDYATCLVTHIKMSVGGQYGGIVLPFGGTMASDNASGRVGQRLRVA